MAIDSVRRAGLTLWSFVGGACGYSVAWLPSVAFTARAARREVVRPFLRPIRSWLKPVAARAHGVMWGCKAGGPRTRLRVDALPACTFPRGRRTYIYGAQWAEAGLGPRTLQAARARLNSSLTASKRRLGSSPKHRHRKHARRRAQKTQRGRREKNKTRVRTPPPRGK